MVGPELFTERYQREQIPVLLIDINIIIDLASIGNYPLSEKAKIDQIRWITSIDCFIKSSPSTFWR
jgi:hypothetical protein